MLGIGLVEYGGLNLLCEEYCLLFYVRKYSVIEEVSIEFL